MKLATLLLPCLLAIGMASTAKADGNDLGLAYLYGYGGFNNGRITSYVPAPPYFALHPPVYYGQRFTRPYGVSPFAAWPQLQSSAHYAPRPHVDRSLTIDNPYAAEVVAQTAATTAVVVSQPVEPLVIDNPFYVEPKVQYTAK